MDGEQEVQAPTKIEGHTNDLTQALGLLCWWLRKPLAIIECNHAFYTESIYYPGSFAGSGIVRSDTSDGSNSIANEHKASRSGGASECRRNQ